MNNLKKTFLILLIGLSCLGFLFVTLINKDKQSNSFSINKNFNSFNLISHKGNLLSIERVLSKPSIFFFGFLNCPDICPNTLIEMSEIIKILGKDNNKINFFFVTVDPERDQVIEMRNYLSNFDEKIIGVTGKFENIKKFLKSMHVYYKKIYVDKNYYTLDHSSNMLVFKKNGKFFGTISLDENEKMIIEKIRSLI